jgi:predicted amidohydrolase YtcJ
VHNDSQAGLVLRNATVWTVNGSITPGKLADLCVPDENLLAIDPRKILETKVVMTLFDGDVVFDQLRNAYTSSEWEAEPWTRLNS